MMSSRDGKLTPIDEAASNPLGDLVVKWREKAETIEQDIDTPYARARADSLRQCARQLERALSGVRAIIRE
jgi:hypothetical protein